MESEAIALASLAEDAVHSQRGHQETEAPVAVRLQDAPLEAKAAAGVGELQQQLVAALPEAQEQPVSVLRRTPALGLVDPLAVQPHLQLIVAGQQEQGSALAGAANLAVQEHHATVGLGHRLAQVEDPVVPHAAQTPPPDHAIPTHKVGLEGELRWVGLLFGGVDPRLVLAPGKRPQEVPRPQGCRPWRRLCGCEAAKARLQLRWQIAHAQQDRGGGGAGLGHYMVAVARVWLRRQPDLQRLPTGRPDRRGLQQLPWSATRWERHRRPGEAADVQAVVAVVAATKGGFPHVDNVGAGLLERVAAARIEKAQDRVVQLGEDVAVGIQEAQVGIELQVRQAQALHLEVDLLASVDVYGEVVVVLRTHQAVDGDVEPDLLRLLQRVVGFDLPHLRQHADVEGLQVADAKPGPQRQAVGAQPAVIADLDAQLRAVVAE